MRYALLLPLLFLVGCGGLATASADQLAVVETVEQHPLTKDEAFARLMRWVAQTYNSAQHVVQLSDAGAGTIIVRGVETVQHAPGVLAEVPIAYTMTIDVRDNRLRFQQQVTGRADGQGYVSSAAANSVRETFAALRASAMQALTVDDDF